MTVLARRIAAVPARSPSETWTRIRELLCEHNREAGNEFDLVAGVMASIIADQTPGEHPFTVVGSGPRVRVYCLYGEDSIEAMREEVDPLVQDPFASEWTVYVPVLDDDLKWVREVLANTSHRFVPYSTTEGLDIEAQEDLSSRVEVNTDAWREL